MKSKLIPLIMATVMAFGAIPHSVMADERIEVIPAVGGSYYFDLDSGEITGVDYNVREMTIPAAIKGVEVEDIDDEAFDYCQELKAINVHSENKEFLSENGVLYSKDKSELIKYPILKKDKSFVIPDGVKEIEEYAFAGNCSIQEITIPTSVESIDEYAFYEAYGLNKVNYKGTDAQWRRMTINNIDDGNIALINASISYGKENPVNTNPSALYVFVNQMELISDQPAVIVDGRTLVPLRAIFEALGATVEWDDDTRTVTSKKGNIEISLKIGEGRLYKNGKAIKIDVPGQIINGRTMVPARAVSEAYDCKVNWYGDSRTVTIED